MRIAVQGLAVGVTETELVSRKLITDRLYGRSLTIRGLRNGSASPSHEVTRKQQTSRLHETRDTAESPAMAGRFRCYISHTMRTVRRCRFALRFAVASALPLLALVAPVSPSQLGEKPQRKPPTASTPARAPAPFPAVSPAEPMERPRPSGGVSSVPVRGRGASPAQEVGVECQVDRDCVLIDQRLGLACCWAGACDPIDYSRASYIAVNQASFEASREEHCPADTEEYAPEALTQKARGCGPMPGCPVPPAINDRFVAACIEGFCEKVPE
jgi:hypothetical protein